MERAKRPRKILGGVMRQSAVLAPGLYALENNVARLAEDHANIERLAKELQESGFEVREPRTTMVFVKSRSGLVEHLEKNRVRILPGARVRLVNHRDVNAASSNRAIAVFQSFVARN